MFSPKLCTCWCRSRCRCCFEQRILRDELRMRWSWSDCGTSIGLVLSRSFLTLHLCGRVWGRRLRWLPTGLPHTRAHWGQGVAATEFEAPNGRPWRKRSGSPSIARPCNNVDPAHPRHLFPGGARLQRLEARHPELSIALFRDPFRRLEHGPGCPVRKLLPTSLRANVARPRWGACTCTCPPS